MPTFAVRFKGMLNKDEHDRLARVGITVKDQGPSIQIGGIKTGAPIYTVEVEASSQAEALQKVREALDPDTGNFSNWEVE